ncbi:MAG: 16S rRNA (guanine(527)-N(7))-methyltransferase RsmG [Patescibacteria group bacterium]
MRPCGDDGGIGRPLEKAEELRRAAGDLGIRLGLVEADKLVRLAELVVSANARVRLTSVTDWPEVLAKHLLDSLAPLALFTPPPGGVRAADLGSGGGFPGLALACAMPGVGFTLIEATRKKADFLARAAAELGLGRVEIWAERSEEAAAGLGRAAFDLVTARAVAGLRVLVELALPLLRPGGVLWAWKGPEAGAEIQGAGPALAALGGEVVETRTYSLPGGFGERALVAVAKTGPTPSRFPRRPGMAEKRPL